MRSSKNMLIIISKGTSWDRGMLNYEIEKAVDYYQIPLIVAYVGYDFIHSPEKLCDLWPKSLSDRIRNSTAKYFHIAFRERLLWQLYHSLVCTVEEMIFLLLRTPLTLSKPILIRNISRSRFFESPHICGLILRKSKSKN